MATVVQLKTDVPVKRWGWVAAVACIAVAGCVFSPTDPFRSDLPADEAADQVEMPSEPKTRADVVAELRQEALAQQAGGEWVNAAAILERALRIDASSPELYLQIAEVRLGQGRFAEAEQVASKGLSLVRGDAVTEAALWQVTAQARSGQGNTAGAQQAREKACSLGRC